MLRRHIAGDADAFSELFRRHKDRLWAVAIRTLADPEEAADAVQDAMISAFRRASSFRGDSAVTTWLHRIVVNACLDRMRRRAVRPAASTGDEQALDSLALGHAVPDPSAASDTALDVQAALRTLPADQQAALVLVDMLGYSGRGCRRGARHLAGHGEKPVRPGPGQDGSPAGALAPRRGANRAGPEPNRRRERLTCAGRG